MFDVAIVGSGPAGASCAAFCAASGLRTLLLERERFPREKVCGDCLNPACWPILSRLQLAERVSTLPHTVLDRVEFIGISGRRLTVGLPEGDGAEIAVKRSFLDQLVMTRARETGTIVREGVTVTALTRPDERREGWTLYAGTETFEATVLVAADGRNSTIARLCNLLPRSAKERIALQTHLPLPPGFGNRVVLQLLPGGYSGQVPVGQGELNLCLVSVPRKMATVREWAETHFGISPKHSWRTITPLTRAPIDAAHNSLFFVGDAARVVEPFTGEGIFYALASGELAAAAIISQHKGEEPARAAAEYAAQQARLYRGRLWINQLARSAVLSPHAASFLLEVLRFQPRLLRILTARVVKEN